MQEEINQFKRNVVWDLVQRLKNKIVMGTKWVFRNKLDENEIVTKNKVMLVAKEYNQAKQIYYEETYPPITRSQAIRLLLAFVCFLDFKLYQMDVKSAFLN